MIEKVNPSHPDKIADRIAGFIVDYAYKLDDSPTIAVEVLIGHGKCYVIIETSIPDKINTDLIKEHIRSLTYKNIKCQFKIVPQDTNLEQNQMHGISCGDNGIFKGCPISDEERILNKIAHAIYDVYPYDGKYILDLENAHLIVCQSHCDDDDKIKDIIAGLYPWIYTVVNPLGPWTGGIDVDTGATNRKLGSDMGHAVTGGGLHGKDYSKCDLTLNIYAHKLAQQFNEEINIYCAIGQTNINGREYSDLVNEAKDYINSIGGFEKFAMWGLC